MAEIELTVAVMPDDEGNGLYEAIESELQDATLKSQWMTSFAPELVKTEEA